MQINTSPNISNFDFTAQLDIAQQVPKAIETDISTYIGNGANLIIGIVFKIIDPSNLQFTTTVYPPDVDIAALGTFTKNLPYFNGQVKWGVYKFYATLIDQDGTKYEWSDEDTGVGYKSINLCKPNSLQNAVNNWGGLKLNVVENCDQGMLEVSDGGTGFSYNGESPSVTEASLVITYPIDSTGTTAQSTATFIPFVFPLTIAGIYSITGTVTQTYQFTPTTSVKAAYYYQKTFDINCGYTLCKALCDYEKLEADVESCSIKNPNEALQQLKTFIRVIGYLGKIAWFKQCGKNFGDVLEKLRLIAGFNCNCDCNPQGIAPSPLYNAGTLVKGNVCGDVDFTLTKFMGNIKIDMSDVTYILDTTDGTGEFLTITPSEGTCQKTYTLSIDVCAMLGTASLGCLSDVNIGSPSPANGDVLVFNSLAGEWQAHTNSLPTLTWIDLTPTSGNWTITSGSRLQYSKDFLGNVRLRGTISGSSLSSASSYALATLPAGYRPSKDEERIAPCNNNTGFNLAAAPLPSMITILTTGQIFLSLGLNGNAILSVSSDFNIN